MNSINLRTEIKDWAVSIIMATILSLFIRSFIIEQCTIEGVSMMPTLISGEHAVVNKFYYFFKAPKRGDIVVFRYPKNTNIDFVKRVIAIPGDTIEIKKGQVFVNGKTVMEPYIMNEPNRASYPLSIIPEGHIFVMGDNRNRSEDSRFEDVGFVPNTLIKGKVAIILWPVDQVKILS